MSDLVWYVAYGSNLCESRFLAYINGSDGSRWPKARGCRDKTPPIRNISGIIPGQIYFAGHSSAWDNGGVAYYDPTVKDSTTLVRMYLVTSDQFNDIFLQENGLQAGDITKSIAKLASNSSIIYGKGWYREIRRLEDIEGYPAFTFTSPLRMNEAKLTIPSKKYLDVISDGLIEKHRLKDEEIAAYFTDFK